MKNPLLFSFVLILLAAVACKKDDDKKSPDEQAMELITSTSWKIDTIGLDTDGNNEIDEELPYPLSACQKDDILTFLSDSTGNYGEGASKCEASDPDNTPFNWMFKATNTVINIDGDLNVLLTGDVDIIELKDNSLKLAKTVNTGGLYPAGTKAVGHFKK